jgi:hypothetical protein
MKKYQNEIKLKEDFISDEEFIKFWKFDLSKPLIQLGKTYYRNGEDWIKTSQGEYPVVFFELNTIKW